jgi:hypothetical protein
LSSPPQHLTAVVVVAASLGEVDGDPKCGGVEVAVVHGGGKLRGVVSLSSRRTPLPPGLLRLVDGGGGGTMVG